MEISNERNWKETEGREGSGRNGKKWEEMDEKLAGRGLALPPFLRKALTSYDLTTCRIPSVKLY
jgi:hypothetical protein